MSKSIFAFSIYTKEKLTIYDCVFSTGGDVLGRILSKRPTFTDEYDEYCFDGIYSYDIESTKEIFDKLQNKEIRLNIDGCDIRNCSMHYIREDR